MSADLLNADTEMSHLHFCDSCNVDGLPREYMDDCEHGDLLYKTCPSCMEKEPKGNWNEAHRWAWEPLPTLLKVEDEIEQEKGETNE